MKRLAPTLFIMISTYVIASASSFAQSVPLFPGSAVALPGTTSVAEPDLVGPTVANQFIPFTVLDGTGGIALEGTLQDQVVQETLTGDLDFYGRITITDLATNLGTEFGTNTAGIDSIAMGNFGGSTVNANFVEDSSGGQGPNEAVRSLDGNAVVWYFESPLRLGASGGASESEFFFAQTDAQNFTTNGYADIVSYNLLNGSIEPTVNLGGIYEPVAAPEPASLPLALIGGVTAFTWRSFRKHGRYPAVQQSGNDGIKPNT